MWHKRQIYLCLFILLCMFSLLFAVSCSSGTTSSTHGNSTPVAQPGLTSITLPQALTNGKPTLAEFGRGKCIACVEMKPILEDLAVEYQNKLNVSNANVDEYRDLTNYYKIIAIPTQICFDSNGKEVYRHVGFWPKEEIIAQLNKMGIK